LHFLNRTKISILLSVASVIHMDSCLLPYRFYHCTAFYMVFYWFASCPVSRLMCVCKAECEKYIIKTINFRACFITIGILFQYCTLFTINPDTFDCFFNTLLSGRPLVWKTWKNQGIKNGRGKWKSQGEVWESKLISDQSMATVSLTLVIHVPQITRVSHCEIMFGATSFYNRNIK
jgi:hypothetical protein